MFKKINYQLTLEILLFLLFVYILILRTELYKNNIQAWNYRVDSKSLHAIGKYNADCLDIISGEMGTVASGPFVKLEPGEYIAMYNIKNVGDHNQDNVGNIDVVLTENGNPFIITSSIFNTSIDKNFNILHFSVPIKYSGLYEFRTFSNGSGNFKYCGSVLQKI